MNVCKCYRVYCVKYVNEWNVCEIYNEMWASEVVPWYWKYYSAEIKGKISKLPPKN
jgi:hypothetical protein